MQPDHASELLGRLPRTFRPALHDQIRGWSLLFPAEQRTLAAQLDWLAHLPPEEFTRLFASLVELESRMNLPVRDAGAGLTVQDTGILARSPLYPRWRKEVEQVFSRIDQGVEQSGSVRRPPRLLICALPSGLPATEPLWPGLARRGTWVPLSRPFGELLVPLASSLAGRRLREGLEAIEGTWAIECDTRLSALAESTPLTALSWDSLAQARRAFLSRLNTIQRDIASVDRTNQELRQMDLARLLGPRAGASPRVREFLRAVFLSGNGSLVFNNSFVQWGASEALRRVRPQVLLACFGIRPKLKPFSSVVLFEDQTRSNPVPDEDDPAGSLADGAKLAEYVWLAAERFALPGERRLALMAAGDLNRVLVLGPNVPVPAADALTPEELTSFAHRWLSS